MKFNKKTNNYPLLDDINQQALLEENASMTENHTNMIIQKVKLKHYPWFIWIVSIVEILIFIVELANNWLLTGSVIMNWSVNPFIGPSSLVLINMGAQFAPFMQTVDNIINYNSFGFFCPNSTLYRYYNCTLKDLCGYHGISPVPNQWYRFITSVFLHVGIIHIGINIFNQLIFGTIIEKQIGTLRFALIYFASGIFGCVLSGNFAPKRIPSVGCSGSVFGILAVYYLNNVYHWRTINSPKTQLIFMVLCVIVDLSIGLLPSINNFGHIGGFCMGLLFGLTLLDTPINLQQHKEINERGKHLKIFYNRPKVWWIWCFIRFIAFVVAVSIFVVLVNNFYTNKIKCSWCKYLSCLPIKNWCSFY